MQVKTKIIFQILLTMIIVGMVYLLVEQFFPRDYGIAVSIDGTNDSFMLKKLEKNSRYYISFKQLRSNKKIEIECTKEQYDFITNEKEYHIIYRKNFFNRSTGKIIKLDDKPIWDGNIKIAIWDMRLIVLR